MRAGGAWLAGLLLAAAVPGCDSGGYQFDSDVPPQSPPGFAFVPTPDGGHDLVVSGIVVDPKTTRLTLSTDRRIALTGAGNSWRVETEGGAFAGLSVAWIPSSTPGNAGMVVSLTHGRSAGWTCRRADTGRILWAGRAPGFWGALVVPAGDVDGDGQVDLLVSDFFGAGGVYVLSGSTGSAIRIHENQEPGDGVGYAVLGAGDIDGDGKGDYLYSSYSLSNLYTGSVQLVNGATGKSLWKVDGTTQRAGFGSRLHLMPDIDGDRLPDVVAFTSGNPDTAPYADGEVRVMSGATGKICWAVKLPWQDGRTNKATFAISDTDGDGIDDLLLMCNMGGYEEERAVGVLLSGKTGTRIGGWETAKRKIPRLRRFGPLLRWKGARALAAIAEESTVEDPTFVLLDPMTGTVIETLHPGR